MSNDISARPWTIDTPGAGVIWQSQVFIKFIEWDDSLSTGAAGTDTFTITDRNSKVIVNSTNQAAHDVQTFNVENWFEGIIVPTLSAGKLRIHVK